MNFRPWTARRIPAALLALVATVAWAGGARGQSPTDLPDSPAGGNILPAPGAQQAPRSPGGAPENMPEIRPPGNPPFLPGGDPFQPGGRFDIPVFGGGGPGSSGLLGPSLFGNQPFGTVPGGVPLDASVLSPTLQPLAAPGLSTPLEVTPDLRFRAPVIDRPIVETSPLIPEPPTLDRPIGPTGPLTLEQFLASVDQAYPPLLSILQERGIAGGELLAARGLFDLDIRADIRNYPLGYYERYYHSYYLEQPTTFYGAKFFGGYRLGVGQIPIYLFPFRTYQGGEFLGGFEFPFLKNFWIDAKRAKLWQARIERQKAEPTIQKYRIDAIRKATKVYWNWVNSGQRYLVADELLKLAVARNDFLVTTFQRGATRGISITDNQQFIIQRETAVLSAQRAYQQAAIEMSLYFRDRYGLPTIPRADQLPDLPEPMPPHVARLREDLDLALRLRPELRSFALLIQKANIELDLARNQQLPGLNLYVYGSQDIGAPTPLSNPIKNQGPFVLEASMLFDVPLQRRMARGRTVSVSAGLFQLRLQERFARDTIVAEVQDAMSALQTSYQQLLFARQGVTLAEQLEVLERRAFELGNSTVLAINLREAFTANARVVALDAETKFYSSLADYRAALGLDAILPDGRKPPVYAAAAPPNPRGMPFTIAPGASGEARPGSDAADAFRPPPPPPLPSPDLPPR